MEPPRWTPRAIVARTWQILRTEGLRPLAFRLLGELGYRRALVLECEIPPPDDTPDPPGVRHALLTADRLPDFLAISQDYDETEARRRLALGHLCQLGYVDGEPASYCWLALPGQRVDIGYVGITTTLSPSHGYIYGLYVQPAHRGTGLVYIGFQGRVRIFRERGVERMAAVVMPENHPGLKHALDAGFRIVGSIHRLHLFGFRRSWIRSSTPTPITLSHASPPE